MPSSRHCFHAVCLCSTVDDFDDGDDEEGDLSFVRYAVTNILQNKRSKNALVLPRCLVRCIYIKMSLLMFRSTRGWSFKKKDKFDLVFLEKEHHIFVPKQRYPSCVVASAHSCAMRLQRAWMYMSSPSSLRHVCVAYCVFVFECVYYVYAHNCVWIHAWRISRVCPIMWALVCVCILVCICTYMYYANFSLASRMSILCMPKCPLVVDVYV